ncbi:hypothetical protein CONPUDRAFT_147567 [Coniophora puteana RWD-64-598 SS2]|uniref:TPR-like protein n=1 Tax=Coniophora puteana (strain RWD-64-598) TaxID=741705 RepID=A0A5M3M7M0_CONPW|nr:uncharacterized protein CONPUDRAFT_147567 [Coniophora puteana RWD-64-598 SS2]EIW75037.1 hypothetical protein CONPUDRAFT_147567 [Coniophora puteana RWD-64-598 SS2]
MAQPLPVESHQTSTTMDTSNPELGTVMQDKSLSSMPDPPPVKEPYKVSEALDDISCVTWALDEFLHSRMVESEEYCHKSDPSKQRMYFATGYGLIQFVKGLMSYEDKDLLSAIGHTRHGNAIASQHRKRQSSMASRLAGYVVSSYSTSGVEWIQDMTPVERHAELTYAESLFEKSLLGIVYSGDWLAFIKEILNMRTLMNIYRQLWKFIETADAAAAARGEGPEDKSIDVHFRSGVYLGIGVSNMILSLIPGKLLAIVELFGYKGDRKFALQMLQKAGGWTKDSDQPGIGREEEGVRRAICDMALLIFHLVLSSFTFDGVDIDMAQKILDWNLRRYPTGVFFLFGAGRLSLCRSQPARAIAYYTKALETQSQYRNLYHISWWEIAIANLALWNVSDSLECWTNLQKEATWSKACYTYGMAVCLAAQGKQKEAAELFKKVPGLRQRIAGKSIPLEKFVARKARKFETQGGRLAVPALELAYVFLAIAHAPRKIIHEKMLPDVQALQAKLKEHEANPKKYENGHGYWDDYCLAHHLEGVCYRFLAYPDPDARFEDGEEEIIQTSFDDASERASKAFQTVFAKGTKIELDHHIVYFAHFEYGRLLARSGDKEGARAQFDMVLSGKPLEVNSAGKKGKYSLENALHVRTHAALEALDRDRLL